MRLLLVTLVLTAVRVANASETCNARADGMSECTVGLTPEQVPDIDSAEGQAAAWAASISAVFAMHEHQVSAADIAQAVFANAKADDRGVTDAISRAWTDHAGEIFAVKARTRTNAGHRLVLDDAAMVGEMLAGNSLVSGALGHAAPVVAITYVRMGDGSTGPILGVVVRDPWRGRGYRMLSATELRLAYVAAIRITERHSRVDGGLALTAIAPSSPSACLASCAADKRTCEREENARLRACAGNGRPCDDARNVCANNACLAGCGY